jgi:hypothetical protein
MPGDYLVPLSLLNVGILGYIGKDVACLVGKLWRESAEGFFLLSLVLWAVHYNQEL